MFSPSTAFQIGKQVVSDFSEKNVSFMAAGIAYNAFVSLAPLLILLLLLVSVVGGGLEDRLVALAENSLPGPIADLLTQIFSGGSAATGVSVVGLVVLVWGTLKIFRGLDTAFSEIYETERKNSFVNQLVDGFVVLVALVVSIVATVAVSAVFRAYSDQIPYLGFLTPVVLIVGLVVAFFPMYYRFPDVDLGWKDVLPGALFAAFGWAALQSIFQVYLVFSGNGYENFFGGILVVVTWLYFSGLVILLGAVLNAVIGNHSTGAPGGVGRGAGRGPSDTESRVSLERGELASYLRGLRERLTGHYEKMEPTTEPTQKYRWPVDDVEVVEHSRQDDDEREWTVTLRWRTPESEPNE